MSRAATSILVFGIYLLGLGAFLCVVPNALLKLFGMDPTNDVWIRVAGMLIALLAGYYLLAARQELTSFMLMTVYLRALVILFFVGFVMAGLAKPILILFGGVDLAGAAWTDQAMRLDKKYAASAGEDDAS